METMQNITADGFINPDYYKQATLDVINRTIEQYNYNPDKITANHLRACLRACYHAIFEPASTNWQNHKCNIPYNKENITALYNIYLDICEQYVVIPSCYGFSRYTGIDENTLHDYVTAAKSETRKTRADYIQNKLSDTPIGAAVLANNDQDTGLMYNRQNLIERETVKQGLTVNDFVKIAQHNND